MIQFTKAAMVSVLALGLVTACGQNAAQDFDGAVIQQEQFDDQAANVAAEVAQENPSPSMLARTNSNGQVDVAFVEERVFSEDRAIQLAQSNQLQWIPADQVMNSQDSELTFRNVNQSGQGSFQQQNNFAGGNYVATTNNTVPVYTTGSGHRTIRRTNNFRTVSQLRTAFNSSIVYSSPTIQSQFFEIRYVSVPLVQPMVFILPDPQIFVQTQTFTYSSVQSCVQNYGGILVQSTCVRPWSVTANVSWQMTVSCNVPVATVPVATGYTTGYPTGGNVAQGSYIQVFQ